MTSMVKTSLSLKGCNPVKTNMNTLCEVCLELLKITEQYQIVNNSCIENCRSVTVKYLNNKSLRWLISGYYLTVLNQTVTSIQSDRRHHQTLSRCVVLDLLLLISRHNLQTDQVMKCAIKFFKIMPVHTNHQPKDSIWCKYHCLATTSCMQGSRHLQTSTFPAI